MAGQHVEGADEGRCRGRVVRDAGFEQRPGFLETLSDETRSHVAAIAQTTIEGLVRVALGDDRLTESVAALAVPHLDDDRFEVVEHGPRHLVGRVQGNARDAHGDGVDGHARSPDRRPRDLAAWPRVPANAGGKRETAGAKFRSGRHRGHGTLSLDLRRTVRGGPADGRGRGANSPGGRVAGRRAKEWRRAPGYIVSMMPQPMRPPAPPMGWVMWSSGFS